MTGASIDGAQLVEVGRGDDWHLDPRLPAEVQCGPAVYANNDLDRGHLVRRRDPVWGDQVIARHVNRGFSPTSTPPCRPPCSTRVSCSGPVWRTTSSTTPTLTAGCCRYSPPSPRPRRPALPLHPHPPPVLEDRHLDHRRHRRRPARVGRDRVSAGPVPQLDRIDLTGSRSAKPGEAPPLGAYVTSQLPVVDLAALTRLGLGPLPAADRLPALSRSAHMRVGYRVLRTTVGLRASRRPVPL